MAFKTYFIPDLVAPQSVDTTAEIAKIKSYSCLLPLKGAPNAFFVISALPYREGDIYKEILDAGKDSLLPPKLRK